MSNAAGYCFRQLLFVTRQHVMIFLFLVCMLPTLIFPPTPTAVHYQYHLRTDVNCTHQVFLTHRDRHGLFQRFRPDTTTRARLTSCTWRPLLVPSGACASSIDIDQGNPDGATALMLAAELGHTQVVKYLIDMRAYPYEATALQGCTAPRLASVNGHVEICKLLIDV